MFLYAYGGVKGDRKIGIKRKIRLNCFQNLVNCGFWQDCGQMNIFATGGLLMDPDAGQDVLRCLHINIGRHGALYLYLYCCVFALTSGDTVLCLRPHLFTGRDSQRPKMVRQFAQSRGSLFWRQSWRVKNLYKELLWCLILQMYLKRIETRKSQICSFWQRRHRSGSATLPSSFSEEKKCAGLSQKNIARV